MAEEWGRGYLVERMGFGLEWNGILMDGMAEKEKRYSPKSDCNVLIKYQAKQIAKESILHAKAETFLEEKTRLS